MSTNDLPIIIGLTGGIASGKSTVSNLLRELDACVIDADVIAREIVEPGEPALEEIREAFGDDVIAEDGTLDRAALGQRIFADDELRQVLNAITHPRIAQRMMQRAHEAGARGHRWVIYDAALIVENNLHQALDSLIVVAAERNTQLARLMARDGLSEDEAEQRLAAQMPLLEKISVANYVVDNNGPLEQTRRQVELLYEVIEERVRRFHTARPPETPRKDDPGPHE